MVDVGDGYRALEAHEMIREGDGVGFPGGWVRAGCRVGHAADIGYPMRRRIRTESPGFRWLDEGERARKSDEHNLRHDDGWSSACEHAGDRIDGPMVFRRRIDALVSEPTNPSEIPNSSMCGCGKHEVDPRGDIYAQHQLWTRRRDIEQSDLSGEYCPVSELTHVPGIGISAEREIEVLCPIDDVDGGGI